MPGVAKTQLTVRALRPVLAGLEALGHAPDSLLADIGIDHGALDNPDAVLPVGAMARFWEKAVRSTRDDALGLHIALAAPVSSFDVHGYALLSSATLRSAYRRACRYQRLLNEGSQLVFSEDDNGGLLQHSLPAGRAVSRQPAEFLVTTWLRLGRLVVGSNWRPLQVFFAHDRPADAREYDAVFNSPIQFSSGRNALQVPAATLDLPNPRADGALLELLDRYATTLLEKRVARDNVSARVRAWLVETHTSGLPAAPQAARALALSPRTLHRRLEEEGTSFRTLLDQFRREKAVELLASGRHGIADVAFLLGYSELSAFYRAFRRWTGQAPAEFRKQTLFAPVE